MLKSFVVWWCLLLLIARAQQEPHQLDPQRNGINRGYIFTAPKRLIAGETENVCLSLHNVEPPVHVSIDLLGLQSGGGGSGPAAEASSSSSSGQSAGSTSSPTSTSSSSSGGGGNAEDDVLSSVRTTFRTGSETCFELRVATNTKHSYAKLRLRLQFEKHKDYVVEAEKKIVIEHDALVTFVETDKAIYKPGQDVNIRILSLKHDFKPWTKPIAKVWIENPAEVRVAQWTNLTSENGMIQIKFPLSSEPSSGLWRIKVEKARPQLIQQRQFEVRKYVLPRFEVTIAAPAYVLADARQVSWKVCARYRYGEPVRGLLRLSLRPQQATWRRKSQSSPQAELRQEQAMDGSSNDGCFNYTVPADLLGLANWKLAPSGLQLVANFSEQRTGLAEQATSRSPVLHQPLKLEFAPHTPKHFKPGLPYHGKLRVLKPDGSQPAPNERVQLCLRVRRKDEWQRSLVECRNFSSSNAEGYLDFVVPPQPRGIVLLSFVATALEYPTKYYSPDKRWRVFVDQPSAYIDVEPWYSPSSSYLSLGRGYQPIVCGEKYSFNVMYTAGLPSVFDAANKDGLEQQQPVTFHYSINSKGDLLVFGHVKYKPRKDTLLDYSEFRNVLGATPTSSVVVPIPGLDQQPQTSSTTPAVHRFPLSVKITPSMSPKSELLLYYVRSDGEVVSSSHTIEVGHCFENPVKTAWHEDRLAPGGLARFHIEAAPDSLCGLSAVDRSTRFLKPLLVSSQEPNLLDAEAAFGRLAGFHLPADSLPVQSTWAHCTSDKSLAPDDGTLEPDSPEEEIDHLPRPVAKAVPHPVSRKRRHSVIYNIGANYVDAIQAFDDFGVIVISDLILESRPCPPWRSNLGQVPLGLPGSDEVDEPDRSLKAVKAMPLAFQFSGPTGSLSELAAVAQDTNYADPLALELQSISAIRSYFPETWIWDLIPTGPEGKALVERNLPDSITDWVANTVCVSAKSGLGIASPAQITAFQPFFLDYSLPYSVKRHERVRLKVSLFNYMHHSLPVAITLRVDDHQRDFELASNASAEVFYCIDAKDSVFHEFLVMPRRLGEINVTIVAEVKANSNLAARQLVAACGPGGGPALPIAARDEIVKPLLVKAEGFPVELTRSAFLCPKDFHDDVSLTWELDLPNGGSGDDRLVEGSASAYVTVIGDVLGPALDNLERLVRLPMGCGEQNMILFVPNIHAIGYLDAMNRHAASDVRARALRNMLKGYQRQLNYRHADGSYSAFGPGAAGGPPEVLPVAQQQQQQQQQQETGSMWLTAFVVKSLAQARGLIPVDERDLKLSVKWIVRRQLENGCFPVIGQIFHKDMKGGLREEDGSSSALTAYVLVALLESGVPLSASLVNNALYCLEKAADNSNPYSAALATYALALLEHPRANESLRQLLGRASREQDSLWWEDRARGSYSLAVSIETTAYGLLSMVKLGGEANMLEARRAVRWLSRKRNAEGGFSSTQDTVVGLEALTKYALAMANTSALDLSLLVTATDFDHLFRVDDDNRMLLKRIGLPSLPTSLEVLAEGEGCVLVQSTLRYHKAGAQGSEAFELTAQAETVTPLPGGMQVDSNDESATTTTATATPNDRCALQRLVVCARYKLPDEESNMAVMEIGLVSGFVADKASLHDMLQEPATGVKRVEDNPDSIAVYFDKLTSQRTCVSLQASRETVVENPEPANIKLYDYYQQELTISTSYRFADVCEDKETKSEEGAVNREPNEPEARKMQRQDNRMSVEESSRKVNQITDQTSGGTRDKKIDQASLRQRSVTIEAHPPIEEDELDPEGSGLFEAEGELVPVKPITPGPSDADDAIDEGFLPSFVNVDHELEVPDGVEGPPPVYVEAPVTNHVSLPPPPVYDSDESPTSKPYEDVAEQTSDQANSINCPRCEDRLPSDFKQMYCSSQSVVKVAVRRARKARLLLDVSPLYSSPKRLRFTVELDPVCSCPPVDKPGNMALLLSSSEVLDLATSTDKTKIILDKSMTMIVLPSIIGPPLEIKQAQLFCPPTQ
ncbi:murinoglobulin-1-like [Trichogramma pretiosum]|uniref:murinoglobulin-1-like n=1 Tax=Trichogramma pretiosum TaxID=7493 RepID=UPI0006C99E4E|nr:murinoglobulin-1-like [Trichogramma pretiosum]